jgi:hypothetical protein
MVEFKFENNVIVYTSSEETYFLYCSFCSTSMYTVGPLYSRTRRRVVEHFEFMRRFLRRFSVALLAI